MINAISGLRCVGDTGLGMTFGSSIVHIPAIITVDVARREERLGQKVEKNGEQENTAQGEKQLDRHRQHVARNSLYISEDAVSVLITPYLFVVGPRFSRWQVIVLDGAYLIHIGLVLFWIVHIL